jgi:hypothetical protein
VFWEVSKNINNLSADQTTLISLTEPSINSFAARQPTSQKTALDISEMEI